MLGHCYPPYKSRDEWSHVKYTNDIVKKMKDLRNSDLYSIRDLAKIFKCSHSTIVYYTSGTYWKNLKRKYTKKFAEYMRNYRHRKVELGYFYDLRKV